MKFFKKEYMNVGRSIKVIKVVNSPNLKGSAINLSLIYKWKLKKKDKSDSKL
jgi:hypothetical protein